MPPVKCMTDRYIVSISWYLDWSGVGSIWNTFGTHIGLLGGNPEKGAGAYKMLTIAHARVIM